MAQRLVVPSLLGAVWCSAVLVALQGIGVLVGPWWALGLVAGPAVGAAAVWRAKASATSLTNTLIDTPMGAFPSAVLRWLINGLDVLAVLGLPLLVALASHAPGDVLTWPTLALQAATSALGCTALIRLSSRRTAG